MDRILSELSNPILSLSRQLELIKTKMYKHKRMLEEHDETNKKEFRKMVTEFDKCCSKIDKILKDYKIISELAEIAGDDRQTLERKLKKRYNC